MRFFSLIAAILVMGALYLLVFDRPALMEFAGRPPAGAEAGKDTATSAASTEANAISSNSAPANTEEPAAERVSVVVIESVAQEVDRAVLVRGRTEAAREVEVKAETNGLVVSDPLRKGAFVEAGQLLCQIDPGTRLASLAEAEARLAEARAGLPAAAARVEEAEARFAEAQINNNAASRLSESGFAAETRLAATVASVSAARASIESAKSGLESAAAGVQSAEAAVALAKKEVDRLDIRSPFAGLLETDTAELGALLQPGAACARVLQLDPIKLVGFVPETQVDRVELSSNAGARLVSGREVAGKVTFLSRSADPETRTFRVEISVPNPDRTIRDGQTAEIAIASEGALAHLVPGSALTLDDTGTLGLRVVETDETRGDVAGFRPVALLRDSTEGVYITGLPNVARVIVVGQEYVTDGVPVTATVRGQEVTQ